MRSFVTVLYAASDGSSVSRRNRLGLKGRHRDASARPRANKSAPGVKTFREKIQSSRVGRIIKRQYSAREPQASNNSSTWIGARFRVRPQTYDYADKNHEQ